MSQLPGKNIHLPVDGKKIINSNFSTKELNLKYRVFVCYFGEIASPNRNKINPLFNKCKYDVRGGVFSLHRVDTTTTAIDIRNCNTYWYIVSKSSYGKIPGTEAEYSVNTYI